MFASGKTVYFTALVALVDFIKVHPDVVSRAIDTNDFSAIPDPEFKDKLDWLFAHFDHDLDRNEWATTLTSPPSLAAYKHLLLSHPDYLKATLQKIIAADITIAPADITLSAPHEAYLRLHAARLGLSDTQTRALIDQQKQAAAAKAIDNLAAQGVTAPDKTQIQGELGKQIKWTNRHTASLQRQVLHHDSRIIDQLHQSFRRVINSQPTTIPQSEITTASRELASLSYQTLKPYIPLVSSSADLTTILKDKILTPDRINRIPTLAAYNYKIPPDLFHQALEASAQNLYHRYIQPAQTPVRLAQMAGESNYHHTSSAIPPPQIPTYHDARDMFWAQGYPGETIINASNPHALENYLAHTPKALLDIATAPIRLVFGEVETSFISLYLTRNRETVQVWSLNRVMPLLSPELQDRWQAYWSVFQTTNKHDPAAFQPLFQDTQTWIKDKTRALHEGNLKVSFDTREKLLEANNNLNVLEFSEKYRALLEKIPGVKQLLNLWGNSIGKLNPIYASYLRAWLGLAFRSDPLTALYLLGEYGAIRPAVAGVWRAIVVPLTRHLPFGWDIKQGTFGMEAYWKPAKWAKDNIKQGLGWLAEKTGLRRAGEWVAQKIFKTTFAKLAAAFTGIATGFLIAWGALKKSVKATAGFLFLMLITHGPGAALTALLTGLLGAGGLAAATILGLTALGITSPIILAAAAILAFSIGLIGGALIGGLLLYPLLAKLWAGLGLPLAALPSFLANLLPALGTITFPTLAPWLVPVSVGGLIFYQIYQTNLRNTAMMAPALGGPLTGDHTGILPPGYVGPDVPDYLAVGNCPMADPHYIGTGSYDPIADTGHGSTSYGVASYPIPIATMYLPQCTSSSTCPFYGYAADIYPSDKTTYLAVAPPKICLENSSSCGDLTWTVNDFWFNCAGTDVSSPSQCSGEHWGWGVVLSASGNGNNWKIYLNHIDLIGGLAIGQKFTSGQTIGAITRDLGPPSHLHIELNINGIPQKPDFLCQ